MFTYIGSGPRVPDSKVVQSWRGSWSDLIRDRMAPSTPGTQMERWANAGRLFEREAMVIPPGQMLMTRVSALNDPPDYWMSTFWLTRMYPSAAIVSVAEDYSADSLMVWMEPGRAARIDANRHHAAERLLKRASTQILVNKMQRWGEPRPSVIYGSVLIVRETRCGYGIELKDPTPGLHAEADEWLSHREIPYHGFADDFYFFDPDHAFEFRNAFPTRVLNEPAETRAPWTRPVVTEIAA